MNKIPYIQDNNVYSILDWCQDYLNDFKKALEITTNTITGLKDSPLGYDPRSALIAAELVSNLQLKAADAVEKIAVDLIHSEEPPPMNEIARAVKMSVTKLKATDAKAEELDTPEEE